MNFGYAPSAVAPAPPFADAHGVARIVAVLMIFAGFADAATTEIGLRYAGVYETNVVVDRLRIAYDVYWIVLKMAAHGLIAYAAIRRPSAIGLACLGGIACLTIAVALNNYALLLPDFADRLSEV